MKKEKKNKPYDGKYDILDLKFGWKKLFYKYEEILQFIYIFYYDFYDISTGFCAW